MLFLPSIKDASSSVCPFMVTARTFSAAVIVELPASTPVLPKKSSVIPKSHVETSVMSKAVPASLSRVISMELTIPRITYAGVELIT
jgi:hypothetical protein